MVTHISGELKAQGFGTVDTENSSPLQPIESIIKILRELIAKMRSVLHAPTNFDLEKKTQILKREKYKLLSCPSSKLPAYYFK